MRDIHLNVDSIKRTCELILRTSENQYNEVKMYL